MMKRKSKLEKLKFKLYFFLLSLHLEYISYHKTFIQAISMCITIWCMQWPCHQALELGLAVHSTHQGLFPKAFRGWLQEAACQQTCQNCNKIQTFGSNATSILQLRSPPYKKILNGTNTCPKKRRKSVIEWFWNISLSDYGDSNLISFLQQHISNLS